MSIFNECLIHLCDCTLLNVMYILKHLLIKPKKIFEYFSCFWKVFCFEKFHKNPKIFTRESRVFKALVASSSKMVRNSLASKSSSSEKDLENFSKFGFYTFWWLNSQVTSSSRGICNSLASESPSCEKDLENFFKI